MIRYYSAMGAHRMNYLTVPEAYRLNAACMKLAQAFGGNCPYLVGSVLTKPDYHDVDVRMMLSDERFAQMFGKESKDGRPKRRSELLLLNAAVSTMLEQATGLPIDFQFQDTTKANEEFSDGYRHALGMRLG